MFPNKWSENEIYLDYLQKLHEMCENTGFRDYTFKVRNFRGILISQVFWTIFEVRGI